VGTWPGHQNWAVPTLWQLEGSGVWAQTEVGDTAFLSDPQGSVPLTYTRAIDAAWHQLCGGGARYRPWGGELQRSLDGGITWETVGAGPTDHGTEILAGEGAPPALYWLAWEEVYRSVDEGATWQRLSHPALDAADPSALAVAQRDGDEILFVGTTEGRVLVLPVDEAPWVGE
jgi:hypothetical protein